MINAKSDLTIQEFVEGTRYEARYFFVLPERDYNLDKISGILEKDLRDFASNINVIWRENDTTSNFLEYMPTTQNVLIAK